MGIDVLDKQYMVFATLVATPGALMSGLIVVATSGLSGSHLEGGAAVAVMIFIVTFMPLLSIGQLFLPGYLAKQGFVRQTPKVARRRQHSDYEFMKTEELKQNY